MKAEAELDGSTPTSTEMLVPTDQECNGVFLKVHNNMVQGNLLNGSGSDKTKLLSLPAFSHLPNQQFPNNCLLLIFFLWPTHNGQSSVFCFFFQALSSSLDSMNLSELRLLFTSGHSHSLQDLSPAQAVFPWLGVPGKLAQSGNMEILFLSSSFQPAITIPVNLICSLN